MVVFVLNLSFSQHLFLLGSYCTNLEEADGVPFCSVTSLVPCSGSHTIKDNKGDPELV